MRVRSSSTDYGAGAGDGWRWCVFRAADGKLATPRTGSTVMRCLGGRNIDPVGSRRTSCATLQCLTTKNPSSKKKKKHLCTQQNAPPSP
ncbi:Uncharacterized protein FWK35_00019902 [Aphis craccivora]|uniref:Uncharacterized protein n=1 Tax=Aphis craccivora TaxID=307492 RepID=A0A6G0Z0I0_APHCR|nr:Uncharacterized protein FWK35_00019902 [Aphis craccivora]